jgi:zinc/manganese transport system substrate-binding protein
VAGDAADVRSIITKGNQDPHGYEATARDQLTLSRADLVLQNGGGYDPFVEELLETTGSDPVLLTAVQGAAAHERSASEHDHEHGENEHVWYSLHAMEELAGQLGDALASLDPANADTYRANAEEFAEGAEELDVRVAQLGEEVAGDTVLATEPVPLLLLTDLGMEDITPGEFLAAIEDARDVPPAVLAAALDRLAAGGVDLVAFNEQTIDATSSRVLEQANANDVPVVSFSELPPEGTGYLQWMAANLDRLTEALG